MVEDDPPQQRWKGLIPTGRSCELFGEHRVLAMDRVGDIDRIAGPKIVDQNRGGHPAAVETLFETLLTLQKSNRRRSGSIRAFLSTMNVDGVELNTFIFRRKRDRNTAAAVSDAASLISVARRI